ncbi:MAG: hypothetical protein P1V51_10930 [Deltaproteobacteria bacterium]|nr:hypothetical protein [Deltaproteobacteria bacterium]
MSRYAAALLFLPLLALGACGDKPPDWEFFSQHPISDELTCGRTMMGDELIRLAYEGEPFEGLDDPEPLPEGALGAPSSLGSFKHSYPCARDAVEARDDLTDSGFTDLALASESARAFVFTGKDPAGFEGHYVRFACDWVSDLSQDLDPPPPWSALAAGISGTFATPPADSPATYAALRELGAVAFRTRMTRPVPSLSSYPITRPVFLGMEETFQSVAFTENPDDARDAFALCATWVEHDVYDRCDYVFVGKAFHVMLDEATGTFHQTILLRQSLGIDIVGIQGWCRRG